MGSQLIDRGDEHCYPGPGWLLMPKYGNSARLGRRFPNRSRVRGRAASPSRPLVVASWDCSICHLQRRGIERKTDN